MKECTVEQFQCRTDLKAPYRGFKFGECISQTFVCDEVMDCKDGSDEDLELCKNARVCENSTLYRKCDNGLCLEKGLWCDKVNNCGDYTDERGCDYNEIKSEWDRKMLLVEKKHEF